MERNELRPKSGFATITAGLDKDQKAHFREWYNEWRQVWLKTPKGRKYLEREASKPSKRLRSSLQEKVDSGDRKAKAKLEVLRAKDREREKRLREEKRQLWTAILGDRGQL